jgi:hypothetical protein
LAGAAGGALTYTNLVSNSLVYGTGSGNETIDASLSKASSTLYGGHDTAGQTVQIAGENSALFVAGQGAETMVGGNSVNVFEFFSVNGGASVNDVITNFSAIDFVFLGGYGAGAAAAAIAGATTSNGSTTITLSDHTKITFTGVTSAAALSGHIGST